MKSDNHTMQTITLHLGLDVHKDSITIAQLLRTGDLTGVYVPEPTDLRN